MDYNLLLWILMDCVFTKIFDYTDNITDFVV